MTDVESIGAVLRKSMREARKQGYKLAPLSMRGMIAGNRCCCALGSAVLDLPDFGYKYPVACERLGISMHEALSIAIGFDGRQLTRKEASDNGYVKELYELGKALRAEVDAGEL